MEILELNNKKYNGVQLPTEKTSLLVIQGEKGMLACGYINIDTANKLEESVVIVTGVKNFDDMLKAKVHQISLKAKEKGVTESMTGAQALDLL
jgi:uncharacterized protein YunC (DUF1805 family)